MSAAPSSTIAQPATTARQRLESASAEAEASRLRLVRAAGDKLTTTLEIQDGGMRALSTAEFERLTTPLDITDLSDSAARNAIGALKWVIGRVRQTLKAAEPALAVPARARPARVYPPGTSPAEVEEARAAFYDAYKDVLTAQTKFIDGDREEELGAERLALLTTKVEPGQQNLNLIRWLLVRTEKWLRKQHGGPRVAYSSG